MTAENACTVYYDGSCPLCRREIGFYRSKDGADTVHWVDVSGTGARELGPDLDPASAMARFHVRDENGALHSGAAGFATLWQALPGWRPLGRIAALPPVTWALERGYRAFLKARPWLQRQF